MSIALMSQSVHAFPQVSLGSYQNQGMHRVRFETNRFDPTRNRVFDLMMDLSGSAHEGYVVVPFRLSRGSKIPKTFDETFEVQVTQESFRRNGYSRYYYRAEPLGTVGAIEVTIPAGTTFVDGEVTILQANRLDDENRLSPKLLINGNEVFTTKRNNEFGYQLTGTNMPPNARVYGDDRFASSATLYLSEEYGVAYSQRIFGSLAGKISDSKMGRLADWRLYTRKPAESPDEWVKLTSFSNILISLKDASNLKANNPEKWEVILRWVNAGGTLFIEKLKPDEIAAVNLLLGLSSEKAKQWKQVKAGESYRERGKVAFKTLQLGLGNVIIPADKPLRQLSSEWSMLSRHLSEISFQSLASENSYLQGERDANRVRGVFGQYMGAPLNRVAEATWKIPGIGEPPIIAFWILITLFFAVVGPINYFFLRFKRRLYLVFFSMPAMAALASFGLIGYSVLADGFTTKAQITSVNFLDEGRLASYSMQTYYSPISDVKRIQYTNDTAVFPVCDFAPQIPFRLTEEEGTFELTGGNISARVSQQFGVIRSIKSNANLNVVSVTAGKELTFENQLHGEVVLAIFQGESNKGKYFCGKTEAGKTNTAQWQELTGASSEFREVVIAHSHLLSNLGGLFGSATLRVKPGEFIALVKDPSDVPILKPGCTKVLNYHLFYGSWASDSTNSSEGDDQ